MMGCDEIFGLLTLVSSKILNEMRSLTEKCLRPNLTRQNSLVPMLSKVDSRFIGSPTTACFSNT